jgi:hypothetical protein
MWPERPNMKTRLNYIPAKSYGLINGIVLLITGFGKFRITHWKGLPCIINHVYTVAKFRIISSI